MLQGWVIVLASLAYLGLGENDAQPCSGDSGGPLLARVGDENVVVAVVSGSTAPVLPVALISPPGPAELGSPVVGGSLVGPPVPLPVTPPDDDDAPPVPTDASPV